MHKNLDKNPYLHDDQMPRVMPKSTTMLFFSERSTEENAEEKKIKKREEEKKEKMKMSKELTVSINDFTTINITK